MKHFQACIAFALLGLSTQAHAQTSPTRNTRDGAFDSSPVVSWYSPQLQYRFAGSLNPYHTIPTAITHLGQFADRQLDTGAHLLMCGGNSTGGVLELWDVTETGPTLLQRQVYPAADILGCVYSEATSELFVLELTTKTVLVAPWTYGGAFPAIPDWSILLSATNLPDLAAPDLEDFTITGSSVGGGVAFDLYKFYRDIGLEDDRYWQIYQDSLGALTTTQVNAADAGAFIVDRGLLAGGTQIQVEGTAGDTVDIVQYLAGGATTSIGSAVLDSQGKATVSTSGLALGEVFAAQDVGLGAARAPYMCSSLSFGLSDPLPHGGSIQSFGNLGIAMYSGNSRLRVPLEFEYSSPSSVPVPLNYPSTLLIGVLGATGFTDLGGGRLLLDGAIMGTETTVMENAEVNYAASLAVPIPNDSGLDGLIVLAQWVTEVGPSDFRIGEIGGFVIRSDVFVPPGSEFFYQPPPQTGPVLPGARPSAKYSPEEALAELKACVRRGYWPGCEVASGDAMRRILDSVR